MISVSSTGDFKKTKDWISKIIRRDIYAQLDSFGQAGVSALSQATPANSGLTRGSWRYRVINGKKRVGIEWYNTNEVNGTPVAILIQYGHATGTGGYVQGRDFINPAMRPIFDKIADNVWKKVKS